MLAPAVVLPTGYRGAPHRFRPDIYITFGEALSFMEGPISQRNCFGRPFELN